MELCIPNLSLESYLPAEPVDITRPYIDGTMCHSFIYWLEHMRELNVEVEESAARVYMSDMGMSTDGLSAHDMAVFINEGDRKLLIEAHLIKTIRQRISQIFHLSCDHIEGFTEQLYSHDSVLMHDDVQALIKDLCNTIDAGSNTRYSPELMIEQTLKTLRWTILEHLRAAEESTNLFKEREIQRGSDQFFSTAIVEDVLLKLRARLNLAANANDTSVQYKALCAQCWLLLLVPKHVYTYWWQVTGHRNKKQDNILHMIQTLGHRSVTSIQMEHPIGNYRCYTPFAIAGMQPGKRYPSLQTDKIMVRHNTSTNLAIAQYQFDRNIHTLITELNEHAN